MNTKTYLIENLDKNNNVVDFHYNYFSKKSEINPFLDRFINRCLFPEQYYTKSEMLFFSDKIANRLLTDKIKITLTQ
jgi:hypothetical protein